MVVQLGKRRHLRHGRHEIAAGIPHVALHPAFLVRLTDIAVVAVEQVVAPEGDEGFLLLPVVPLQDPEHGRLEVVVADAVGDATKEVKRLDMAFQEGFLLLHREGHGEAHPRVVQPHHKQLHGLPDPTDLGDRFGPVHLGVLPRVELQREKRLRPAHRLALLPHIAPHRALPAQVALLTDQLVDPVRRVALLAWLLLAFLDQLVDPLLERAQHGGRPRRPQRVAARPGVLDRLAHCPAAVPVLAADLANALALDEVRPTDSFVLLHFDHLLASAYLGKIPW